MFSLYNIFEILSIVFTKKKNIFFLKNLLTNPIKCDILNRGGFMIFEFTNLIIKTLEKEKDAIVKRAFSPAMTMEVLKYLQGKMEMINKIEELVKQIYKEITDEEWRNN